MSLRARLALLGAVGAALLLGSAPVRGEVRAITDRTGNYRMTRVLTHYSSAARGGELQSERDPAVWQPVGRGAGRQTLNPEGDSHGDLWPVIVEPRVRRGDAWVLWSRRNGASYDLAWSRFRGRTWTPAQWVYAGIPGDDLDPRATVDASGRHFIVWWAERDGLGSVYFSMYLETRWMVPLRVSDAAIDARHPTIAIEGNSLVIRYRTAGGTSQSIVRFARPATITDDINPLGILADGAAVQFSANDDRP